MKDKALAILLGNNYGVSKKNLHVAPAPEFDLTSKVPTYGLVIDARDNRVIEFARKRGLLR